VPLTPVTITGTITRADGTHAEGTFTATLSGTMANGTTVVEPTPISGLLTAAGPVNLSGLPFVLDAVDDTGTSPPGRYYRFVFELDNAPPLPVEAVISHISSTVDLSTLIPETP
jgi:hypothetical protein